MRWVGILQALLAGWVVYVGAGGMLFEGALLLMVRRRLSGDFAVAAVAAATYLFSLIALIRLIAGAPTPAPRFHFAVFVIVLWTAMRWAWLSRGGRTVV